MQNWQELYTELCTIHETKVPEIVWQDLWHNQVNFLEDELPFSAPALFYSFRILSVKDLGEKAQEVKLQITTRLYYETMADTYHGSANQGSAMAFLDILTKSYGVMHGTSGTNYSNMRRIGFAEVDTGSAGNMYMQVYECTLIDYSAAKVWEEVTADSIEVELDTTPAAPPEPPEEFYIPG